MLRVRHIVRQYAPATGGLETFVALLARHLAEFGCESDVLTLDRTFVGAPVELPAHEVVEDVRVQRVPMIGHRRMFSPIVASAALRDYDVLHVHGIDGMFERIARHQRRGHQICVATSHGLFFHTPWMAGLKRAYFSTITKIAAARYDGLIANSAADEQHLKTLGPPVVQIPNGVAPIGDFTARGRDLLCLGRLSSHKRVDRLVAMMASPALSETVLHIVGPDWDVSREALAAQAAAAGVSDRVRLHGRIETDALAAIADQCAVFVSASEYEGFGMSLIEAMSVGLVPAVEPNASFRQLMADARLGALVSFEDPGAAAIVVRGILDRVHAEQRATARQFAAQYSWSRNAEATAALYASLIEQRAQNV